MDKSLMQEKFLHITERLEEYMQRENKRWERVEHSIIEFHELAKSLELKKSNKADVENFKEHVRVMYVTREYFWDHFKPVRRIVYGAVGLVLVSVFTSLVYLVLK